MNGYAAPQLHTHAVVFNVTETSDGGTRALQLLTGSCIKRSEYAYGGLSFRACSTKVAAVRL